MEDNIFGEIRFFFFLQVWNPLHWPTSFHQKVLAETPLDMPIKCPPRKHGHFEHLTHAVGHSKGNEHVLFLAFLNFSLSAAKRSKVL
jgi:hypothetical protein